MLARFSMADTDGRYGHCLILIIRFYRRYFASMPVQLPITIIDRNNNSCVFYTVNDFPPRLFRVKRHEICSPVNRQTRCWIIDTEANLNNNVEWPIFQWAFWQRLQVKTK